MHEGCLNIRSSKETNIYESANSDPPETQMQITDKLLEDDRKNGIWK